MQINRLFETLYILLDKKTVTAKELADKFEVSVRTIYRDIEILSAAKVPIYTSKGKGGGISLLDDYVLNKFLLSEGEQNQILFALKSIEKLTNQDGKDILEKMSVIFNKNNTNWIEIDFSDWGANNQDESFNLIKEAILRKKALEFVYYNSKGIESKRVVYPLQIYFKSRAWYLRAFCKGKHDYRLFKISRISEIKILNESYIKDLPSEIKKDITVKTINLELEISKEMSYRVYDEFKKENITKNEKGNFIVKVEYPLSDWIYGYILSFGEYVKDIKPEWIKNVIIEKLQKSIKNFL